jgi:hypothetical protein
MSAAADSADTWWWNCGQQAIDQAAAEGTPFQAYDLVLRYGLDEPRHANQWGPLLAAGAARKAIRKCGYAPSKRPETNSSIVRTWVGVGA